jgi:tetratricopeptide (TPR) repeat protein
MGLNKAATILLLAGIAVAGGGWPHAAAQFGPVRDPGKVPQAQTQQELDQYLVILTASEGGERIAAVEQFARLYPESALLGAAYHRQMLAYEAANDAAGVVRAGRRALPLLPDNLQTLLTLGAAIPNTAGDGPEAARLLEEARGYARRALVMLDQFRVPREFSVEESERMRAEMRARAHESLGHAAGKLGDWQAAAAEFREAIRHSPVPEGRHYFRLGVACAFQNQRVCAAEALQKAADLGPDVIRARAREQLSRLSSHPSSKAAIAP